MGHTSCILAIGFQDYSKKQCPKWSTIEKQTHRKSETTYRNTLTNYAPIQRNNNENKSNKNEKLNKTTQQRQRSCLSLDSTENAVPPTPPPPAPPPPLPPVEAKPASEAVACSTIPCKKSVLTKKTKAKTATREQKQQMMVNTRGGGNEYGSRTHLSKRFFPRWLISKGLITDRMPPRPFHKRIILVIAGKIRHGVVWC